SFLDRTQLIDLPTLFDLSHSGVNLIAPYSFENCEKTEILDLSFNNLTKLYSNSFYGMLNLKTIFLSNNRISKLESDVFKGLNSLTSLGLINNNLSIIEPNYFDGLINLVKLDLNGCNIKEISLSSLANLKILDLGRNKINFFSQNLSSLRELYLTNNPLRNLTYPLITSDNSKLETLGISNCQLKYIDFEILKNYPLQTFGIAENSFNFTNETFNGFKSLKRVKVDFIYVSRLTVLFPNINFNISF
ncbi:unnamed protein product, partial [Brachionus calyciflorus]